MHSNELNIFISSLMLRVIQPTITNTCYDELSVCGRKINCFHYIWEDSMVVNSNSITCIYWTHVRLWIYKFGAHMHVFRGGQSTLIGWWVCITMNLSANVEICLVWGVSHTTKIYGWSMQWATSKHEKVNPHSKSSMTFYKLQNDYRTSLFFKW